MRIEVTLESPAIRTLSDDQIRISLDAIGDIEESYRVLKKPGLNIVGEVLRGQGKFYEMDHYPKNDVYDQEHHTQYYYHAHRQDHDEHGHFHLFVRSGAMDDALEPIDGPAGKNRVAHLIAIAMDGWGYPTEIFAVNRWVTDESWFPAETVITLVDSFKVDHAHPNLAVNLWLTAMVRCFRPQIETLLRHRDEVIALWQKDRQETLHETLENRQLEVTGTLAVDVGTWKKLLEQEYRHRLLL
jgi:hypothetical protein